MSEPVKLLQEETENITNIRKNYFNIQSAIGQIHLSRHNFNSQLETLDKQEHDIMTEYTNTQNAEKEFIQSLQDKYGMGTLNIGDGEFTPTQNVETEKKS
jgi:septal ring factor EnvC (AmiA/AmiB activator)